MSESKFKDVFGLLKTASKECLNDDDPMFASEDFSLFESMSATVIMDEKMDPCYGISCSTFENFIATSYKKCGPTDETTATLLLQELFIREVALLDGASLLESLHQNLHMWPDTWKLMESETTSSPSDKWVSTYCRSSVAANTVFLRLVMNADIFEDEDFQFQSKVSSYLSQDEMESLCKQTDLLSQTKDNTVITNSYVQLFFQHRTLLFQLHESIDELISHSLTLPLSTRGSNSSSAQLTQMMNTLESQGDGQLEESDGHLQASLNKVYGIAHSLYAVALKIVTHSDSSHTTESASVEHKQFIENSFLKSLMNLQQTSPARAFPLLSLMDSLKYVQDMCEDILCMCTALNTMLFQTENIDLDTLLQWFMGFSRNKSNVLVRSYLAAVWTFAKPHAKVFLLNSCDSRGVLRFVVISAV
jgi:hypothetical protein